MVQELVLEDSEIDAISKTWSTLMKNPKESGTLLFINLFKAYPEYKLLFVKLERISMEDLKTARQMKAHGATVMNALNAMVQNIDDLECLEELMISNGRMHARFGLTLQHYRNLWVIFIETCRSVFGDKFTDESARAWMKVFAWMEKPIMQGLKKAGLDED